ncbi:MAG: 3-phosphoshikimate 1-carboxyvinyltransferase [Actinomycetota bacterium]|nr:3-phosphoshikimate 1-carboxyvinyltransferase [Actinomycetota bacterium]
MSRFGVESGGRLAGRLSVPGDKSISHRVLLLAALADGVSTIRGLSDGDDVARTRAIVEALGVEMAGSPTEGLEVRGGQLREPEGPLDVGNSGTGIRLLAGMLAGLPFVSVLDGDRSIRSRPMDRIIEPLRIMGAEVDGSGGGSSAPLRIGGGCLHGIDYHPPMASAQVKGCVLFAGLSAEGPTTVIETVPTRAHTEELMVLTGVNVQTSDGQVTIQPGRPNPFEHSVAGDPSQAAFWAVGTAILPDSEVVIEGVYSGPARTGFVDVLDRMGASIDHDPVTGDLTVRSAELTGTIVEPSEVPGLVDEVPVLAVAAACAQGETRFVGVGELRIKESDRLSALCSELGGMGAQLRIDGDDLIVQGGGLVGGEVDSHGDHRIAMACAVAALVADGRTTVTGWEAVSTSYPTFDADLVGLRV